MTVDQLKRAAMHLEEAERRRLLFEACETRLVPMGEVFAQARARRAS